jgi:hypothetical protein
VTITDTTLLAALRQLTADERKMIERHIKGEEMSAESWELMRMLRRRFKRKIRSRVPRLIWLA